MRAGEAASRTAGKPEGPGVLDARASGVGTRSRASYAAGSGATVRGATGARAAANGGAIPRHFGGKFFGNGGMSAGEFDGLGGVLE